MRRCLIFDAKTRVDLEDKIGEWLKKIEDEPIFDLKFHYCMWLNHRSILITYIKEEEQ